MSVKTIKFAYKYDDDYRVVYTNGAHGGISPQGEVVMNLFMERLPVPDLERRLISDEGLVGDPVPSSASEQELEVVRHLSTGVVMNIESAKRIFDLLKKMLDAVEKRPGGGQVG